MVLHHTPFITLTIMTTILGHKWKFVGKCWSCESSLCCFNLHQVFSEHQAVSTVNTEHQSVKHLCPQEVKVCATKSMLHVWFICSLPAWAEHKPGCQTFQREQELFCSTPNKTAIPPSTVAHSATYHPHILIPQCYPRQLLVRARIRPLSINRLLQNLVLSCGKNRVLWHCCVPETLRSPWCCVAKISNMAPVSSPGFLT